MHIIKKILFVLLVLTSTISFSQIDGIDSTLEASDEETPILAEPDKTYKFGIKLGTQFSTLLGEENKNSTFRFGLNGGLYVRRKFETSRFALQLETNISLRGSNFNNNDTGYSIIKLYYIDMPFYLLYNLSKDGDNKAGIGFQASYIIGSTMFKGKDLIAVATNLNVKNFDVALCAVYQLRIERIAFQFAGKYGLLDINNGLAENMHPPNSGKNMQNFLIELNMLF